MNYQPQTTSPLIETKTHWPAVFILWIAGLGAAMQFAKVSVSFDRLVTIYHSTPGEMGLVLSIVGAISLFFGATAGLLIERIGFRQAILGALLFGTFLAALQAFLVPLPLLLFCRFLEGSVHLILVVALPTLMLTFTSSAHRAIVMGLWGAFFSAGFTFTSLWGAPLVEWAGPQALLASHAFIMAGLFLVVWKGIGGEPSPPIPLPFKMANLLRENLLVYTNLITSLPGILFFFHGAMFISLLTFVPQMANTPEETARLSILLPLICIGGTLFAGLIAQYLLNPLPLAILSFSALCLAAIYLAFAELFQSSDFFASCLLLFISGMIQGAIFALVPFLAKTPTHQAHANGAITQLANLGGTILTPIFAAILDLAGADGFVGMILILALGGIAMGFLGRHHLKKSLDAL